MSKITYIFAILGLTLTSSLHHKVMVLSSPDIVIIDTGTTKSYSGLMRMERSCEGQCWHKHGEQMSDALADEISGLGFDREVYVEHLVWERYTDIPLLIDRATSLKPKVIVLAIAGVEPIVEEMRSIIRAQQANILVVAASGNHGFSQMEYPAGYKLDCLVGVSTKEFGSRYHSANVGDIYLDRMSGEKGTSFSTARSAAIALKFIDTYNIQSCKTLKTLMISQFGSTQ